MKRLTVTPPAPVRAAPARLGRLGPALAWLAAAQGSWPPVRPAAVRRLVVAGGTRDGGPGEGRDDALAEGLAEADELADAGCDLLVLGADEPGIAGLVVLSALLDLEPVQAVGTSGGADWAAQAVGVRDGLRLARLHVGDPAALLRAVGDEGLARLTGLLAQCAVRRTPVVLDGSPQTAAAALLADRVAPGAAAWWLAGQVPPAPAARLGLADLGLPGLLDLGLALPAGADLAHAVLEQAVDLVTGA